MKNKKSKSTSDTPSNSNANQAFFRGKNTASSDQDAFFKPAKQQSKNGDLPEDFQTKMETSFNEDFSDVQFYKNSNDAKNLNARAFTQGNAIHFKDGEFDASSSKGQELIAHELAHVVQQRQGLVQATHQENGFLVNEERTLEKQADMDGRKALNSEKVNRTTSKTTSNVVALQKKLQPIQLRRILPSGAPLAELAIDSNKVMNAFETLWARRPSDYNSAWLFDTPDNFSDHPDLPDSIRTVCGGDYFRGNNYWSSGWVDDGDNDFLWGGDADIKAEMTLCIDNERRGATRSGTYGSTSSTTQERSTQNRTTVGGKVEGSIGGHEGAPGGTATVNAENQITETNRMTVTGGSNLSMEIPSTAIRADIIMYLSISFRPSIGSVIVNRQKVRGFSPVVGTLLLGAPIE